MSVSRIILCLLAGLSYVHIFRCSRVPLMSCQSICKLCATTGRCRKAGGLCMLLAMPAVTRKERINGQRVKIMQRAIDSVNKMHKKEVQNQVLRVGVKLLCLLV